MIESDRKAMALFDQIGKPRATKVAKPDLFGTDEAFNAFVAITRRCRWVLIYVEGYDTSLPEDEIKKAFIDRFSTCGKIYEVHMPREPDRRASILVHGLDAEQKALALNGTDVGGWNVVSKLYRAPISTKDICFN